MNAHAYRNKFNPTNQQTAFWNELRNGKSHILLEARAGTGKTTSIIEGHRKILDSLPENFNACFCAFSKAIQKELETKVPHGLTARTLHAILFQVLRENSPAVNWKRRNVVNSNKTYDWIDRVGELYGYKKRRDWKQGERSSIYSLVSKMKNQGVVVHDRKDIPWGKEKEIQSDKLPRDLVVELNELCSRFDISTSNWKEVYAIAIHVLCLSCDLIAWDVIDFDDMIYLPYVFGMKPPKNFDLLYVDEAQDLNEVQKAMTLRMGLRIVVVGDRFQSIYGFRGADCEAIPNLEKSLSSSKLGLTTLPLTVSFRCPRKGILLAKELVSDIEYAEDAEDGEVFITDQQSAHLEMSKGDMVMCRTNAPLIIQCYKLWKEGRKAYIQGRDFGSSLLRIIEKFEKKGASSIADLNYYLSEYHLEELQRLKVSKSSANQQQVLEDKIDCLQTLFDDAFSIEVLKEDIKNLFPSTSPENGAIRLTTIHRAKGLEADRCFLLSPDEIPHPMAKLDWEKDQEKNIAYVAVTRFKKQFYFIGSIPIYFKNSKYLIETFVHPSLLLNEDISDDYQSTRTDR